MSSVSNESSGQQSTNIHIDSSTDNKRVISVGNYSDIVYYFYGASINVSDGFVFLISLNDAIIPVTWYVIRDYYQNNIFKIKMHLKNTEHAQCQTVLAIGKHMKTI